MKNISIAFNVVLAVAVGVLYYLHFTDKPVPVQTADKPIIVKQQEIKASTLVYVNSDSLLEHYEYYLKVKKEMETERAKIDAELERRGKALENFYLESQKKAQSGLMTQDEMKMAEQKLMQDQQSVAQFKEEKIQKQVELEKKINDELYQKITDYLREYTAQTGYNYVFGYARGGGILYANDSLNVTAQILKGLNEAYRETLKK